MTLLFITMFCVYRCSFSLHLFLLHFESMIIEKYMFFKFTAWDTLVDGSPGGNPEEELDSGIGIGAGAFREARHPSRTATWCATMSVGRATHQKENVGRGAAIDVPWMPCAAAGGRRTRANRGKPRRRRARSSRQGKVSVSTTVRASATYTSPDRSIDRLLLLRRRARFRQAIPPPSPHSTHSVYILHTAHRFTPSASAADPPHPHSPYETLREHLAPPFVS